MNQSKFMVNVVTVLICLILTGSYFYAVQAAGTPALTVSNASAPVNGALDVTVINSQSPTNLKDWVGLYEDGVTPGSQPSIWWDYILNLGVTDGNGSFTFNPANIPSAQQSRYTAGKKYKFILAYNDSYTVSASVSFNATTSQNPVIISINPVIVNTGAGIAPTLPTTVTANYSNGTNGAVNVTWNGIAPALYSQAGSFTVKGVVASTGVVPKASVTVSEGSGPVLSFQVISDTHIRNTSSSDIYNQHLSAALKDLNQLNPNSSALIIDGDITDGGSSTQYDQFHSILQSVNHPTTYFVMGNHDIFNYSDYTTAKNMFLTKTGMGNNYYDYWINGYHFIVLGSDAIKGNVAVISTTQLNWFQQTLNVNASPNKPIFVFIHQPLSNTVSGSNTMQDIQEDQQLKSILAQFPQVVFLTGHTHSVFTESTEFYNQQYCNMANVPSTAYLWYDPTYTQPGNGSQGVCVDVYTNKVVIKGREFTRQEWLGQGTFLYNSAPTPTPVTFNDNFNDNSISNAWSFCGSGAWSEQGTILRQDSTTQGDPCKAILSNSGKNFGSNYTILAKVYVDFWTDGDSARAGVSLFTGTGNGQGYNLLFHNNHSTVQFLDDGTAWGPSYTFNWANRTWYWFKLKMENGALYGKVWQDGVSEPTSWPYSWTRSGRSGYPALNAGTSGHGGSCTAYFDDVTVTAP